MCFLIDNCSVAALASIAEAIRLKELFNFWYSYLPLRS